MNLFQKIYTKRKHGVSCVGIIRAVDGSADLERRKQNEELLKTTATIIRPNDHSIAELVSYLIDKYQAIETELSFSQLNKIKAEIILRYYQHLLQFPRPLKDNATDKQILRYFKKANSYEQALAYPIEKLNLDIHQYEIKTGSEHPPLITVDFISKNISIENVEESLLSELILFKGITQKDIDTLLDDFQTYFYYLKEMGQL